MKRFDKIKEGFKYFRRLSYIFSLLLIFFAISVFGYMIIEGYNFLDAFYMTVISITTAGYQEVHPLSDTGRLFTSFVLITNIGLFFYAATQVVAHIIEGEFKTFFKHYNVEKQINKLENHVIVCGYGRTGKQVCLELQADGIPFLVIENRGNVIEHIKKDNVLFINENATEEEALVKANIKKARAIVTTLPNDPDNVYVVLTAREINPGIFIISRASSENSERKLKRAGANNVIMPEKIGGAHMAALVSKPDILEFVANLTGQGSDINITFEEIALNNISENYKHKSIKDLDFRNKTGANVIGLRLANGEYIINPSPDTLINPDTKLVLLGSDEQIKQMRKLISEL
jgi:voltage-gated potassium channel